MREEIDETESAAAEDVEEHEAVGALDSSGNRMDQVLPTKSSRSTEHSTRKGSP